MTGTGAHCIDGRRQRRRGRQHLWGISSGHDLGHCPRAQVIAYKGLGNLGGFTSDLASAIDQAVADGVDVINYSVGGGAAGPGADEIAFLFARRGRRVHRNIGRQQWPGHGNSR